MKHINNSSEFRYERDLSMFSYETCQEVFSKSVNKPYEYTKKHDTAFQVSTENCYFKELHAWYEPELDLFHIKIGLATITVKGFENLKDLKNLVRKLHDHYKYEYKD